MTICNFYGSLDDGSRGMKSGNKRSRSKEKERGQKEENLLSRAFLGRRRWRISFLFLAGQFCDAEIKEDKDQKDNNKQDNDEFNVEEEQKDIKQEINDVDEEFGLNGKSDAKISGLDDVYIDDYLDHFSMVKKMINLKPEEHRTWNFRSCQA